MIHAWSRKFKSCNDTERKVKEPALPCYLDTASFHTPISLFPLLPSALFGLSHLDKRGPHPLSHTVGRDSADVMAGEGGLRHVFCRPPVGHGASSCSGIPTRLRDVLDPSEEGWQISPGCIVILFHGCMLFFYS